mgnify:FL=1
MSSAKNALIGAQRSMEVFELVKAGYSYRDVARSTGLSVSMVSRLVEEEIAEHRQTAPEHVAVIVEMELERLDRLSPALFPFTQPRKERRVVWAPGKKDFLEWE